MDHYIAKRTDKDCATLDEYSSPTIDHGSYRRNNIKNKHVGPTGRGVNKHGHSMSDDDGKWFDLQSDPDRRPSDEYEDRPKVPLERGISVILSISPEFAEAVDYSTYRLHLRSSLYDGWLARSMGKRQSDFRCGHGDLGLPQGWTHGHYYIPAEV